MAATEIIRYTHSLSTLAVTVLCLGCASESPQETAQNSSQTPMERVFAKHILIQYEGAAKASARITRTKKEAKAHIEEILEKARQGETFEDLAMQYSDGPSAPKGGDLGGFGQGMMVPAFEKAAFACEVGEITDVIETPFGYHIIYRYEPEMVSAKHILVQFQGCVRALPEITRTQEEARARIDECLEKARQGEKFEDLAAEYSDGPSAPKGGDLGRFERNQMDPDFEEAAFACEVGEITDVVETPFGYHIIYRYK